MDTKRTVPKIQDVARVAGVSTATVSRVLNQPAVVAETTRENVLRAIEETGYRINVAASNLRRRRTGAIVVLVPDLGNPFFSRIMAGIESVAAKAGFSVLIADTRQPNVRQDQIFAHLHRARADGLVVLDGTLSRDLLAAAAGEDAMPPIVFACEWLENDGFPSVVIDNGYGAELAVRHLHQLGHRRIGHVQGPDKNVLTDTRCQGTKDALRELGLEVRPDWFIDGDFSLRSGVDAARTWLDMNDRPTAVFCASDQMACGFISELNQHGLSVPGDVSVIGFDDIDIAKRFIPSLTTVRQARNQIGATAAELLIERIEHPPALPTEPERRVIPIELVVRDSTGAPPVRANFG